LARQFARKSLPPMFDGECPDGNLGALPEKIETAFKIGIASSPDVSSTGSQYGIWGSDTDTSGMTPSLTLLKIIAETCGGVAMCLHSQGVATNILLNSNRPLPYNVRSVALSLQEGMWPPPWNAIMSPTEENHLIIETTAHRDNDSYLINGTKSFIYSINDTDGYVVMARTKSGWGCFLIPSETEGVIKTDVGVRTGLRACRVEHVTFNNVKIPHQARIDHSDARDLIVRALCLSWAGMCAIAVGIARGAALAARKYASERYQGGDLIENHPAVKMLIASSESSVEMAESMVQSLDNLEIGSIDMVVRAAEMKLIVMDICSRAVTDCLQTFGGYGYMEDFGMEKRLRDITVLKSALGSPLYLKRLIFEIGKERHI